MTHDELLAKINKNALTTAKLFGWVVNRKESNALRAVVELHKPYGIDEYPGLKSYCQHCEHMQSEIWPCPTIQAIEKELK